MTRIPQPTTPLWTTAQRARLVRLCAAVVGPDAAEDVAQEALLEAWRHRERLVEPAGADAWLGAIARNVCRRWLRSRGTDRSVPAETLPERGVALDDGRQRPGDQPAQGKGGQGEGDPREGQGARGGSTARIGHGQSVHRNHCRRPHP